MSRSYRTQKESVTAEKNIQRDLNGSLAFPRIIVRQPKRGDIHPISKRNLLAALEKTPPEYIYGLSRIELRPRQSEEIGKPFAYYSRQDKSIILYSLPLIWTFKNLSLGLRISVSRYHALISKSSDGVQIEWPEELIMSLWFLEQVFHHELGHHFVNQFKHKNKRPHDRQSHELIADIHSAKLSKKLICLIRGHKNK